VWERDDDIASLYVDEPEQTDNTVSSLWQLIFSDSSEVFSAPLDQQADGTGPILGQLGRVNVVDGENSKRQNGDAVKKDVRPLTGILPGETEKPKRKAESKPPKDIPPKYVFTVVSKSVSFNKTKANDQFIE
jgi:hypothetical protein